MEKLTAEILADLYRLDPGLKEKETELAALISKLVAARPEAELDEAFRRELRERLLSEYRAHPAIARPTAWTSLLRKFFETPKFGYAMGGAAILLLIAFVASGRLPSGRSPSSALPQRLELAAAPQITRVADNAFGPLTGASSTVTQNSTKGVVSGVSSDEAAAGIAGPPAAPMLGSGNFGVGLGAVQVPAEPEAVPVAAPTPSVPLGLGGGGGSSGAAPGRAMGFAPEMTEYRFKYSGAELSLPQNGTVEVLKRDRAADSSSLAASLSALGLGLVDLGRLRDAKIQNLTLSEDREYGYSVNVNLDDGSINVSQNWPRWPQPYAAPCQPDAPCGPPRLELSDLPSDSEAIGIADAFLAGLGVSTAGYDRPVVDNAWRIAYDAAPNKADYWIPDQLTVAYQLLINGRKVYSEDGSIMGMMVAIDVRTRRAAGVSQIYLQNYQSSAYAAVTDAAKVLDYASRGGFSPVYAYGIPGSRTIEVELGSPDQAYMAKWIYKNGTSDMLLVPALAFPIRKTAETAALYRDRVVVPLAEELLAEQNGGPMLLKGGPVPVDLPAPDATAPDQPPTR